MHIDKRVSRKKSEDVVKVSPKIQKISLFSSLAHGWPVRHSLTYHEECTEHITSNKLDGVKNLKPVSISRIKVSVVNRLRIHPEEYTAVKKSHQVVSSKIASHVDL